MVYKAFLQTITDRLQQELGDSYQIRLQKLPKNNGMILDGLCIQLPDDPMAPAIYLNPYYDLYLTGLSLEAIIQDILALYRSTDFPSDLKPAELSRLELMKSKVMFRVIHAASNQDLLQEVPHMAYLDLAIVFYLYLDHSSVGQMTALIRNEHMHYWELQPRDFWNLALVNTPLCFPAQIQSMEDLFKSIARQNMGACCSDKMLDKLFKSETPKKPLYVLTNQRGIYGAGCMLYQNILKDFADSLGKDLYILPSSIHEVLITPVLPEISYTELSHMVTTINRAEVPPEDQLSNQVYLYTRTDDHIRIVSNSPSLVGYASVPDADC